MRTARELVLIAAIAAVLAFEYCAFRMGIEINKASGKERRFPFFVLFGFFPLLIRHGKLVPKSRTRLVYVLLMLLLRALFDRKFTGKEREQESGNDYFGARYYASSMGRLLSPDPLLNRRMAHPYRIGSAAPMPHLTSLLLREQSRGRRTL